MGVQGYGRTDPTRTAELALLFLSATARDDEEGPAGLYYLAPSAEPVTREHAIAALAAMSKPAVCTSASGAGSVEIQCHAITDSATLGVHRQLAEQFTSSFRDSGGAVEGPQASRALVVLLGGGERLVVTRVELEAFMEEYFIPYAVGIDPPSASERASGIVAVWRVTAPSGWVADSPLGTIRAARQPPP
jgi:hypothetical protein